MGREWEFSNCCWPTLFLHLVEKVDSDGVQTNNGAHYLLNRHRNINKVILLLLGCATRAFGHQRALSPARNYQGKKKKKEDQDSRIKKSILENISRVTQELY